MDDEKAWHSFEEPGEEANQIANLVIGAAIEVHRHLGPRQKESNRPERKSKTTRDFS
jgi:phosphoglycerate dehydrogenase-like enzyme